MEPKWLPESPGIAWKVPQERPRIERSPPSATRSSPGIPTRPPECPKGASRDPFRQPREPKCTIKERPRSPKATPGTSQNGPGATTYARNCRKHPWHHSDRLPTIEANDNENDPDTDIHKNNNTMPFLFEQLMKLDAKMTSFGKPGVGPTNQCFAP